MKRKVLIIDDEPVVLDLMEIIMEEEGFSVIKAINGKEALVKAETEFPDLIILDIMMPRMDGWKTLEKLKASNQTSHIPVVILTAVLGSENRTRALEAGACEYIYKPFSPREVVHRIHGIFQ